MADTTGWLSGPLLRDDDYRNAGIDAPDLRSKFGDDSASEAPLIMTGLKDGSAVFTPLPSSYAAIPEDKPVSSGEKASRLYKASGMLSTLVHGTDGTVGGLRTFRQDTPEAQGVARILGPASNLMTLATEAAHVNADLAYNVDPGRALAESEGRMITNAGLTTAGGLLGGPFGAALVPFVADQIGITDAAGRLLGDRAQWDGEQAKRNPFLYLGYNSGF